jgi:hypothetical protein
LFAGWAYVAGFSGILAEKGKDKAGVVEQLSRLPSGQRFSFLVQLDHTFICPVRNPNLFFLVSCLHRKQFFAVGVG